VRPVPIRVPVPAEYRYGYVLQIEVRVLQMLTLLTNLFGFLQTEDIAHPLGLRVALEKQARSNSFYVTQVKSL